MKNFWKFGSWLLVILVMLFLGGCAKPDSEITKAYEIDMETTTGSNVVILVLDADVDSTTAVKQDAKAEPKTQIDAALTLPGKITEAAGAAKTLLDVVKVPKGVPAEALNVVRPSKEAPDGEYDKSVTYSMDWNEHHNRSFTWLPQTGAYYGGPIRLTFDNGCQSIDVPNAQDNYGRTDGIPAYFCGTKNRPEESNGNRASVFSNTGCRAGSVTVHYDVTKQIVEKNTVQPPQDKGEQTTTETGIYKGRKNGDRALWYFPKNMAEYPETFSVTIPGCETITVHNNNGHRYDPGDGNLVKQSDEQPNTMAVHATKSCLGTVARI